MRFGPALLLSLSLLNTPLAAQERSLIVLDGSGSMWGQIEGRPKLEIAREALGKVVQGISPEVELGLMAYGHRTRGQCDDIELIVPPAAGSGASIVAAANAMKFQGKTPLSDAVRLAAEHLRFEEDRATVILITDGIETCNADPCALANELEASGVDFTAHVVGFGLSQVEGEAVACLAHNTGGKFIEAKDAASLEAALQQTVALPAVAEVEPAPPEPAVLEHNILPHVALSEGSEVDALARRTRFTFFAEEGGAAKGDELLSLQGVLPGKLPPGRYIMRTSADMVTVDQLVELTETALAEPVAILNAGQVVLSAVTGTGGKGDVKGRIELSGPDGTASNLGTLDLVVPAGEYAIRGEHSDMVISDSLVVDIGQVIERDIVFSVGSAEILASYDGTAPADFRYSVALMDPVSKKDVATSHNPALPISAPPGDYIAEVRAGHLKVQAPVQITAAQTSRIEINMNAGILSVTAPKMIRVRVLGPEKDANGKHPEIASVLSDRVELPLTAGSYILQTTVDNVDHQQPFTISAGQRVEMAPN
ncbi:VWA domain-containing protein [Xinfangfangia sp. CPCC 101601]|uniref:VWA domain-containing protein n=1 Tax=Pseudogemmobacter lacusdianii TaxID=3069608 RepID=A0ABU0VUE5_9RHOB|nr:VWA domain-containing protein [Xinfangfangia sp. CPCC 101601]MDQ2065328.1 VWA domain-containing protein [Xinfangfangia sp. CPCC 101601]